MEAVLVLGPTFPSPLAPYIVKQVSSGSQADYDTIMRNIKNKPQNLLRFFTSCSQELLDGLGEAVLINRWQIMYTPEKVTLDWEVQDVTTGAVAPILFTAKPGDENTIEQFLEQCPGLNETGFARKDIRKLYVISKKIVKTLPRVVHKGTPLRGLYQSPAT